MPELPEVTTTVRGINETVKGKIIENVWTDWPKLFSEPAYKTVSKKIRGKKILNSERIAKYVLIHLSEGLTLVTHMKMTGHFMYGSYKKTNKAWQASKKGALRDDPFNRFIHVVFSLSNKKHLVLCDMRKFARIRLIKTEDIKSDKYLSQVGPDALDISKNDFVKIIKSKKGRIKNVLMKQDLIAGIGNIYSDESLFGSGIHPESSAAKIPSKKLEKLHSEVGRVLKHGIKFGGDSDSDYRDIHGKRGEFQHNHEAYRRTGSSCPRKDGGTIKRKVVGGRSAHFCSKHQKKY